MSSYILKVLDNEANVPQSTGTASSFTQAKRLRLVNRSNSDRTITIVQSQGGTVIGTFTMAPLASGADGDIIIEKDYTHCVFADGNKVVGVKVGIVGY
tara:strand:+ start:604 stop:897 length:294 start_codon:yes stop_codon:yes gene_type:complete